MAEFERTISVAKLIEDQGKELSLEVLLGQKYAAKREISKASVNRPGLAMDGHLENFRGELVQIIGRGEYAFCAKLPYNKLKANFKKMLRADKVPCVIVTAGMKVLPAIKQACLDEKVPLLSTSMDTAVFISELIAYLDENTSPRTHVHGVLIKVSGLGVLIRGDAGIGKSECALELIKRGHILVADDVVNTKNARRPLGRFLPADAPALYGSARPWYYRRRIIVWGRFFGRICTHRNGSKFNRTDGGN